MFCIDTFSERGLQRFCCVVHLADNQFELNIADIITLKGQGFAQPFRVAFMWQIPGLSWQFSGGTFALGTYVRG